MNKIAASGGFLGSESLRGVLLYLSQHTLEYPGTTVKEYEIATQVLGRSTNFDSRIDSTVRAIASRLRSKLAEYYLREGQNDPILIDIPKGSYALSFSSRVNALHTQPEHPTFDEPRSLPASAPKPRGKWRGLAIAATLVIGVGWLAYIAGRRSAAPSSAVPTSIKTFWGDFLEGGDPLIIFRKRLVQLQLRATLQITPRKRGSVHRSDTCTRPLARMQITWPKVAFSNR